MKRRSWEGYAAKHPERVALIERTRAALASGKLTPEPCDRCGRPAPPLYDWPAARLAGWRCYPCRRDGAP